MSPGYIADFWLAGTSSGNLVAAKIPRIIWGEEDVDVRSLSLYRFSSVAHQLF